MDPRFRGDDEREELPQQRRIRAVARSKATTASAEAPLREGGSNPFFFAAKWIASRSLSSGTHSATRWLAMTVARGKPINASPKKLHAASVFSTSLIQYEVPKTIASSLKS